MPSVPVIWNIGAIASSGHPRAARHDPRASCWPRRPFPAPSRRSMIDVDAGRQAVPGDACRWRRLRPGIPLSAALDQDRARRKAPAAGRPARAYRHPQRPARSRMGKVERRTLGIAGRAIATMIAICGLQRRDPDLLRSRSATASTTTSPSSASDFTRCCRQPFDQRLHERAVRLRLPARPARLRLGEEAADPLIATHGRFWTCLQRR